MLRFLLTSTLLIVQSLASSSLSLGVKGIIMDINRGGAITKSPSEACSKRDKFDILGFVSYAGAAVSAFSEVREDFEKLGHGHGMLFLCGSKICGELNAIREATEEGGEEIAEKKTTINRIQRILLYPLFLLYRIASMKSFATVLSMGALYAASMEVIEDSLPGGHHGAIFLALNELIELAISSSIIRGERLKRILEKKPFRMVLLSGAAVFALLETFREKSKIAAHHGVALLAISKLLDILGSVRSEMKEKEE